MRAPPIRHALGERFERGARQLADVPVPRETHLGECDQIDAFASCSGDEVLNALQVVGFVARGGLKLDRRHADIAHRLTLNRPPEVQHVSVAVHDFESPQLVRVDAERLPECNAARREFLGQGVRIRSVDVRVPPSPVVPAGIRRRLHLRRDGFQHEPNAVSLQHCKIWILVWAEECQFETQTLFIECDGGHDIAYNKEGRDKAELCLSRWDSHKTSLGPRRRTPSHAPSDPASPAPTNAVMTAPMIVTAVNPPAGVPGPINHDTNQPSVRSIIAIARAARTPVAASRLAATR